MNKSNFESGFVFLSRSFLNWKWYGNPIMMAIFIDMLLKANYKDIDVDGVVIKRGEFTATINSLCRDWGQFFQKCGKFEPKNQKKQQAKQQTQNMTIQMVRTIVQKFKESGELETFGTGKFTIFRIVNYDLYQNGENWKNDCGKLTETTNKTTTIKEDNKYIYAQNSGVTHKLTDKEKDSAWMNFYTAYPRKQGKQVAEKKFKKICTDTSIYFEIMEGLNKWQRSKEWADRQYIPYPGTWLNQERWKELPLEYQIPEGGGSSEELMHL